MSSERLLRWLPRGIPFKVRVATAVVLSCIFLFSFIQGYLELEKERTDREFLARTNHWVVMQIEQELLRLLDGLARYVHGEPDVDGAALQERYDVLWSRFPIALTGPESETVNELPGARETLQHAFEGLRKIEAKVTRLQRGDLATYREVRSALESVRAEVHDGVLTALYGFEIAARDSTTNGRGREPANLYLYAMLATAAVLLSILLAELWNSRNMIRREREARLAAVLASRGKTEFLANISHELRTPLHAIIGFADLAQDDLRDLPHLVHCASYLADIKDAGDHLLSLVNDLLDLARVESGRLELHEEEFDAVRVLEVCVRLLMPKVREGRLVLGLRLPETVFLLRGDERLFRQSIINVLGNAVKFTPADGRIDVDLDIGSDGLLIRIRDTGHGIAPEHLLRILEPFEQGDGALDRRHDGVGLGLALARRFLELHGGSLTLTSRPGVGTTVHLFFPKERVIPGDRTLLAKMVEMNAHC